MGVVRSARQKIEDEIARLAKEKLAPTPKAVTPSAPRAGRDEKSTEKPKTVIGKASVDPAGAERQG